MGSVSLPQSQRKGGLIPKSRLMTQARRQAFLDSASSIQLSNRTIEHLKELQSDMPLRNSKDTFDELVIELIKVYRKKKGLDETWPE